MLGAIHTAILSRVALNGGDYQFKGQGGNTGRNTSSLTQCLQGVFCKGVRCVKAPIGRIWLVAPACAVMAKLLMIVRYELEQLFVLVHRVQPSQHQHNNYSGIKKRWLSQSLNLTYLDSWDYWASYFGVTKKDGDSLENERYFVLDKEQKKTYFDSVDDICSFLGEKKEKVVEAFEIGLQIQDYFIDID